MNVGYETDTVVDGIRFDLHKLFFLTQQFMCTIFL